MIIICRRSSLGQSIEECRLAHIGKTDYTSIEYIFTTPFLHYRTEVPLNELSEVPERPARPHRFHGSSLTTSFLLLRSNFLRGKYNHSAALQAFDAKIHADPYDLPQIAAAGMLFFSFEQHLPTDTQAALALPPLDRRHQVLPSLPKTSSAN